MLITTVAIAAVGSLAVRVTAGGPPPAHTGTAPGGARPDIVVALVIVGCLLVAAAALVALGLLLCACSKYQTRPGRRSAARATVESGGPPGPLVSPHAARLGGRSVLPAPRRDKRTPEPCWRPVVEEVPGAGRVEWDPRTLRAFAGQPEVLRRLAFHRWRCRRGMLSEFGQAELAPHDAAPDARE